METKETYSAIWDSSIERKENKIKAVSEKIKPENSPRTIKRNQRDQECTQDSQMLKPIKLPLTRDDSLRSKFTVKVYFKSFLCKMTSSISS